MLKISNKTTPSVNHKWIRNANPEGLFFQYQNFKNFCDSFNYGQITIKTQLHYNIFKT